MSEQGDPRAGPALQQALQRVMGLRSAKQSGYPSYDINVVSSQLRHKVNMIEGM